MFDRLENADDKLFNKIIDINVKAAFKLSNMVMKYMKENNIAVVIDKKNVLMGDKKFEITSQIIEILNKEFKSINLN